MPYNNNWFINLFSIYLGGGATGKGTKKTLAKFKNSFQFINQFNVKLADAMDRYHIEGLPDTVSERVILESLVWYGSVVFFEKEGELMALPCVPDGAGFNVYGDVGSVWAFSRNGVYNKNIDCYIHGSDESSFLDKTNGQVPTSRIKGVCVWENQQRYPFINQVIFYAQVIADTLRALDVARENLKRPYLLAAPESVIPSIVKTFEDRDDNMKYIISSGNYKASDITMFPLVTDGNAINTLTALIEWYEAKFRELCGINNNSQMDKKGENLIQAEVSVNDEYTDLALDKVVDYLQFGLDDVNKIFGTNLTAEKNRKEQEQIIGEEEEDERNPDIQGNNN